MCLEQLLRTLRISCWIVMNIWTQLLNYVDYGYRELLMYKWQTGSFRCLMICCAETIVTVTCGRRITSMWWWGNIDQDMGKGCLGSSARSEEWTSQCGARVITGAECSTTCHNHRPRPVIMRTKSWLCPTMIIKQYLNFHHNKSEYWD